MEKYNVIQSIGGKVPKAEVENPNSTIVNT
jgi:hypothetical protein